MNQAGNRNEQLAADVDEYDRVLEAVRRIVADLLRIPFDAAEPEAVLLDLGAESFHFVALVHQLQERYSVEIPIAYAIPDAHTIQAFAQMVHGMRQAQARR